jgi:hypothetical protein
VEQQLASLARAIRRDELALEGFAAVHVVRTAAELDALEIAAPQAASR